jgi:hypothetical protein
MLWLIVVPSKALAQDEEVIQLEEITIKLEAELPTVMVTIGRQAPEIRTSELTRPIENMLVEGASIAKPRPGEFEINKIENPKKILAKVREP